MRESWPNTFLKVGMAVNPVRDWLAALVLLAIVGVADYITGYELPFLVFYFPSVFIVSWGGRWRPAVAMAAVCACVSFLADLATQHPYSSEVYRYCNFVIWLASFVCIAVLVLRVRWLLDAEEKLNGELKLALDRLRQAEQEREERARELARSNRDLEEFAAVASHDMQEPLRMITQFLHLLRNSYQGRLDQDADDYIQFAVDGADRMQALIRDLLAYARVGSGGKSFSSTDCEKVLNEALANVAVRIEETGALITREALPTVKADSHQLVQVFQNLIWNAIKFRGKNPPQIHIGCRQEANEWLFWVRDNGIGIAPEFAERVFQIFKRLHTREQYAGTGIGLAVCKRVIERHQGRIWVESQPGQGATFYFTIPTRDILP